MAAVTYNWYRTPIGFLTLASDSRGLCKSVFGCVALENAKRGASPVTTLAAQELLEYFSGKRRTFDIPLSPAGSDFQREVWAALAAIPYGTTVTATQLAENLGIPSSFRAVGSAVADNPLAVILPDHRLVTAKGTAPGSKETAKRREWLLLFEQAQLEMETRE